MKTPCTHYAGQCDRLVCDQETERRKAEWAEVRALWTEEYRNTVDRIDDVPNKRGVQGN